VAAPDISKRNQWHLHAGPAKASTSSGRNDDQGPEFIDIYAALDDAERASYERDYPSEAQTVSSFFQRCRDEGRQQGVQQGVRQGECAALMRVMHHKFGDIPEPARLRIESADPETLLEWLDRALVAASIDEVIH
jgi:hypothetical protein